MFGGDLEGYTVDARLFLVEFCGNLNSKVKIAALSAILFDFALMCGVGFNRLFLFFFQYFL
jgi:hypothetical protein